MAGGSRTIVTLAHFPVDTSTRSVILLTPQFVVLCVFRNCTHCDSVDNTTTSGLRLPSSNPIWYCGRVSPGRERAFERGLRRLAIPTYFPVHLRIQTRNRYDWRTQNSKSQVYEREYALFPGYIFAALERGQWPLIRERIAYKPNWLDFGSGPVQIPIELIEQLQLNEQNGFVQVREGLCVGDELEITGGVWFGRKGILASDPDRRILTLHLIAESYSLQPTQVLTKLKIDRNQVSLLRQ